MQFRSFLRILAASLLAYSVLILAPKYTAQQCSKPELRGTAPCMAFFTAQDAFQAKASVVLDKVNSYPQLQSLTNKYNKLELDRHLAHGLDTVSTQWNTVVKPKALRAMCKSAQFTVKYSNEYYNKAAYFVKEKALPAIQKHGKCALTWTRQQAHVLWVKVENSRYWEDVIVPQALKIYDTVLNRAQGPKKVFETASAASAEATSSAAATASASAEAASSASSALESSLSASSASASASASSVSASSASLAAAAASSALESSASASASASVSSALESSASASASASASSVSSSLFASGEPSAQQWAKKVQRNVDFAIKNLQDDAVNHLENAVAAAKPEIMATLRQIAAYGEDAVKEVGKLAAQVTSDTPNSEVTKQDIFDAYDTHLKHLADLAYQVRDRSEKLAHDSLEGLDPVRLVTLDAIDDYFDAMLSEAAREMTQKDEWQGWKEYNKFKQTLAELRSTVESYEFDMTVVNTALRESQSASIILVQQYNQKLADLRAECQLIFQQREAPEEPESAPVEPESVPVEPESVPVEEAVSAPVEEFAEEPVEEYKEEAEKTPEEETREDTHAQEAEEPIEIAEEPIHEEPLVEVEDMDAIDVPFEESIDFEEDEVIETQARHITI